MVVGCLICHAADISIVRLQDTRDLNKVMLTSTDIKTGLPYLVNGNPVYPYPNPTSDDAGKVSVTISALY